MMTAELPGSKEYCCFLTLSLSHPLSDSLSQSHLHAPTHTHTHVHHQTLPHFCHVFEVKVGKKLQQKSFFCGSSCFFGSQESVAAPTSFPHDPFFASDFASASIYFRIDQTGFFSRTSSPICLKAA